MTRLFTPLASCFFSQPRGSSKFGPEAPIFSDQASGTLILHLPKNLLILCAIEQVVLAEFRGVIEVAVRSHLLVDVLGFDIEEERVCIGVQESICELNSVNFMQIRYGRGAAAILDEAGLNPKPGSLVTLSGGHLGLNPRNPKRRF